MDFMNELAKNEKSITENGAIGYKTTGHKLVDLNFGIPSYREKADLDIFDQAFAEDKALTLKWLLFLRDVRGGAGERKSFREFALHLFNKHPKLALKFLDYVNIAEYGRWDDYVWLWDNVKDKDVKNIIAITLSAIINIDLEAMSRGENISLASKWMPSNNTSSKETRRLANKLAKEVFKVSPRQYRKMLSKLRKYLDVVEVKTSANQWSEIDYCKVPSCANLKYANAFFKHDQERREEYLNNLANGDKSVKINAKALFLHDIVHKYTSGIDFWYEPKYKEDATLEELWKAQEKVVGFKNTLVVRDGSGSMTCNIPNSSAIAMDVADALTLYCAENSEGQYHNKFITFSSKPQIVDVNGKESLADKLTYLHKYADCSNTNIEAVFDLILETAVKAKATQDDMPKSILIVSDMEYDAVRSGNVWSYDWDHEDIVSKDIVLFEHIANKYEKAGYELPKLIFWNVNSRTNTIPLTESKAGVILLSGFSQSLMEMVMSSELDPYKALVNILNKKRYAVVEKVLEE